MKKLFVMMLAMVLTLTMVFTLASCGNTSDPTPTPDNGDSEGGTIDDTPAGGDEGGNTEAPTKADYVITVVDQNGDAVVGAAVSICTTDTGTCSMPINTNDNGVATHKNKKIQSYAAQVVIPDGYSHAEQTQDASGSTIVKINFAEGATTITIVLTRN